MLFAMPSMRRALALKSRPAYDADTRAGRLSVGDAYLQKVLYGGIDTMAGKTGAPGTPAAPRSGGWFSRFIGGKSKPQAPVPKKNAAPPQTPKLVVSSQPKAVVAAAPPRTVAELKARGYEVKGTISKQRTAIKIAGRAWNRSDTYYLIKGRVVPGDKVDTSKLWAGVSVWMKK
jgi:hypothetical protein